MIIAPRKCLLGVAAICLAWALVPTARADEESAESESLRCINARTIRRTHVINDNYVVFWVQGRRLYLNALSSTCNGLSRDRRFSFETTTRSLCARDKIRILKESGGGFYEGRACSLGRFQPMTEEGLLAFIAERTKAPEAAEVTSAEVEEVIEQ